MNRLKRIGVAALSSAMLAASACLVAQTQAQAQDAPHGDAGNGKRIYLAVGCFTCHGRSGQGGAFNGPAPILASTALPFDGFKGQVRDPSNDMPAYSDAVLSDKDIADIFAFVKSLPGPRSPKDISILNN
jgi:mono/diheme cytochrome c family protein